ERKVRSHREPWGSDCTARWAGHDAGTGGRFASQSGTMRHRRPSGEISETDSPRATTEPSRRTIALAARTMLSKVMSPLARTNRQSGKFVWKPAIFSEIATYPA